jgi:hypothetical protein
MTYPYLDITKAVEFGHLVAHWRLNESSGTAVADSSGNGFGGTASNVTWGQAGMGDGATGAGFNGTTSYINIYSAGLAAALNGAEGGGVIWFKTPNTAVWTDAHFRYLLNLYSDGNNNIGVAKTTANKQLAFWYMAGGTQRTLYINLTPDTAWHCVRFTWSAEDDAIHVYLDGVEVGTGKADELGAWSGSGFNSTYCQIGANWSGGSYKWSGNLAHVALWDAPGAANEAAALALVALITPITDRTLADVLARNSNAFFNIADYARINANTIIARQHINALYGLSLGGSAVTLPGMGDFVDRDDIYLLAHNIYAIADASVPEYDRDDLEYDFNEGGAAFVPDYQTVNLWEHQLEQLFDDEGP